MIYETGNKSHLKTGCAIAGSMPVLMGVALLPFCTLRISFPNDQVLVLIILAVGLILLVIAASVAMLKQLRATALKVQVSDDALRFTTLSGDFAVAWKNVQITWTKPDRVPVYVLKAAGKTFYIWARTGEHKDLLMDLRNHANKKNADTEKKVFVVPSLDYFGRLAGSIIGAALFGVLFFGLLTTLSPSTPYELGFFLGLPTAVCYGLLAPMVMCNRVAIEHERIVFSTLGTGRIECGVDDILSVSAKETYCYVRTKRGNFCIACYVPDYDICSQMIVNFAGRAITGQRKKLYPGTGSHFRFIGSRCFRSRAIVMEYAGGNFSYFSSPYRLPHLTGGAPSDNLRSFVDDSSCGDLDDTKFGAPGTIIDFSLHNCIATPCGLFSLHKPWSSHQAWWL